MEVIGMSFDDYMDVIKELIKNNKKERNDIGRSLREINFTVEEVEPNYQYFRECYDANEKPDFVLKNIDRNESDLFRLVDNLSNDTILNEVKFRDLESDVLDDCYTTELEDELESRYDSNFVNKYSLTVDELIELLSCKKNQFVTFGEPKDVICEALGFYNSFSPTYEEVCEELKKLF